MTWHVAMWWLHAGAAAATLGWIAGNARASWSVEGVLT